MTSKTSRRDLLKASLAGTALLSAKVQSADNPPDWDAEYDVIVVGSGTGMLAALVAAEAGKRVLVVEKDTAIGGNTIVSGGVLWVPNNSVARREGLADSEQQARAYLRKLALGQADEELIEAFIQHGPTMVDYMERHTGLRFRVSKLLGDAADYHPEWPGGTIKGRSIEPEMEGVALAGGVLMAGLMQACEKYGVEVWRSCPATRLLLQGEAERQQISGVLVEREGKPLRIRARGGVLLASGGFERNAEMKLHFLRGPSPYTLGAESNEGDGIRMGMAAGADLRNMNEVWGITVYKEEGERHGQRRAGISLAAQLDRRNAGCICVNRYGERFCNEAADYDSTWRSYQQWENWGDTGYRNLPAFHIFDDTARQRFGLGGRSSEQTPPDWFAVANTLPELAEKLGIDAQGLQESVTRFNRFAEEEHDPDFKRGESSYDVYGSNDPSRTLAPLTRGPFYGAEVSPADLGTCGGVRVNAQAEAVDVFGAVIPGLYASGNCAGVGAPGALYGGGGGTIGPALTFAFIAGQQLARS